MNIYIRINKLNSAEYVKDLRVLKQITDIIKLSGILIPKVEEAQEIDYIIKILDKEAIDYPEIIPMIETKIGVKK